MRRIATLLVSATAEQRDVELLKALYQRFPAILTKCVESLALASDDEGRTFSVESLFRDRSLDSEIWRGDVVLMSSSMDERTRISGVKGCFEALASGSTEDNVCPHISRV